MDDGTGGKGSMGVVIQASFHMDPLPIELRNKFNSEMRERMAHYLELPQSEVQLFAHQVSGVYFDYLRKTRSGYGHGLDL